MFDLLDAGDDPLVADELQSGCACGPYQLSRKLLANQIKQGEKRVIVEQPRSVPVHTCLRDSAAAAATTRSPFGL